MSAPSRPPCPFPFEPHAAWCRDRDESETPLFDQMEPFEQQAEKLAAADEALHTLRQEIGPPSPAALDQAARDWREAHQQ